MAFGNEEAQYVTYLFGNPIAHSWSPLLHNTLYRAEELPWTYQLFESNDIKGFLERLRDPKCQGSSVTMPHKIAVIPFLDALTLEGRQVGACNTVFIRTDGKGNRRYIGTNTDVVGIRESFTQNVYNISAVTSGRPGLVIGGGGAARSAVFVLNKWMNCSTVYIVNRDEEEVVALTVSCKLSGFGDNIVHISTVEQAQQLAGPVIAVGCVPDFPPVTAAERQAREIIRVLFREKSSKGVILEMAYHPTVRTELARLAEASLWRVIPGTEAVIWQGIEQHLLWTRKTLDDVPVQVCKDVFAQALSKVQSKM